MHRLLLLFSRLPESYFYFNRSRANWGSGARARAFIFAVFHWHIIALDRKIAIHVRKMEHRLELDETKRKKIEFIPKCETASNWKTNNNNNKKLLTKSKMHCRFLHMFETVRLHFILSFEYNFLFSFLKFAFFTRKLVWKAHILIRHNHA